MPEQRPLEESVDVVAEPWKGSPYYDEAEKWTYIWWSDSRPFKRMFDRMDQTVLLELACGHGRHGVRAQQTAGRLLLMDVLPENVEFCRNRIKGDNVEIMLNNGFDFKPVEDEAVTGIYCYDAMVHFSQDIVASYLKDAHRILKPGGMALLHHSNYSGPQAVHYGRHPGARNYMPRLQFQEFANQAGLAILESVTFTWAKVPDLDCLTLLQKV